MPLGTHTPESFARRWICRKCGYSRSHHAHRQRCPECGALPRREASLRWLPPALPIDRRDLATIRGLLRAQRVMVVAMMTAVTAVCVMVGTIVAWIILAAFGVPEKTFALSPLMSVGRDLIFGVALFGGVAVTFAAAVPLARRLPGEVDRGWNGWMRHALMGGAITSALLTAVTFLIVSPLGWFPPPGWLILKWTLVIAAWLTAIAYFDRLTALGRGLGDRWFIRRIGRLVTTIAWAWPLAALQGAIISLTTMWRGDSLGPSPLNMLLGCGLLILNVAVLVAMVVCLYTLIDGCVIVWAARGRLRWALRRAMDLTGATGPGQVDRPQET